MISDYAQLTRPMLNYNRQAPLPNVYTGWWFSLADLVPQLKDYREVQPKGWVSLSGLIALYEHENGPIEDTPYGWQVLEEWVAHYVGKTPVKFTDTLDHFITPTSAVAEIARLLADAYGDYSLVEFRRIGEAVVSRVSVVPGLYGSFTRDQYIKGFKLWAWGNSREGLPELGLAQFIEGMRQRAERLDLMQWYDYGKVNGNG